MTLLIAVFVTGFIALSVRLQGRHPLVTGIAGVAFAVAVFVGGAFLLPWWVKGWVSGRTFSYLRWDLLAVLAAFLFSTAILTYVRGVGQRVAQGAIGLAALVWVLFYLVEASVLATTGIAGSYFMLQDLVVRPFEVLPLLVSELEWVHVAILGGPLVTVLSAPHVARLCSQASAPGRQRAVIQDRYGMRRMWWVGGAFAALVAFAPVSSEIPVETSMSRFVQMASYEIAGEEAALSPNGVEGFDTRSLYLAATDSTRAKNVVVIVMESIRSRSMSLYNDELDTTPFLDSLARYSLVAERFYTPVSYTNKSIVSLFGGIYPGPEGYLLEGEALPGGIPARGLPSLLDDHGYRSAFFTPAIMAFERKDVILANLGFDEMYGDSSYPKAGFAQKAYFGYEDRVALDATLDWVEDADVSGEPFLLGLLTLSSHHPYDLPPSFETRPYGTGDPDLEAYLNSIRYTDSFVRDLMAGFEKRGLLDKTVFIVVGDHGEAFGEHSQRMHGDVLWDEALQIPALVYAPGIVPAGRISGARSSIDIVPTVLDVLNLDAQGATLPGVSLLEPNPADRTLFHACRNARAGLAVRKDSLKYVYWIRRPTQVFNTAQDPEERFDIAADIPHEQVRRVESEARTWYFYNEQAYEAARVDAAFRKEDRLAWRSENEARYERAKYWQEE
ncbi:MAG: LTA synthase family protein [Rhodothermales bacterium]